LPISNILSKYKTVLNPIVPTSRLAKLANILGIIETSSRSIGLFVKLGNHDQYGTSIIVYVIPHTIYKIDTKTYKLVPVKTKFINIIIVIIEFNKVHINKYGLNLSHLDFLFLYLLYFTTYFI